MRTFKNLILILLCFFSSNFVLVAQTVDANAVDGRIYVKFKNDAPMNFSIKMGKVLVDNVNFLRGLKDEFQITSMRNTFWQTTDPSLHRIFMIEFANKTEVNELIKAIEQNPEIEYAEKAPYYRISFTPNDANYATVGNRWHLDKINATTAWDVTHGSATIKIAVIDNAINTTHPDLVNKVVSSIDLADGDANTAPPATSTIWSHGTHTSGLVGAQTNNSTGTASIGFDCSIIAIKAGKDADGGQGVSSMYEGITWAADNGADILSMSFGGPGFFATMQMIVDYAYNKGCVLVAAAGNNGAGDEDPNNVNYIGYPAACNHVISVGATNGNDKAASFSEFGTWIDVMAPGGYQNDGGLMDMILNNSVYSTTSPNTYGKMQGTSMACPIAAGLCGLMLSVDPTLTPDKVEQYLKATCTNIESLQDAAHQGMVGAGRINAFAAVTMVQDSISPVVANFTCSGNFINAGGFANFTDLSVGTITGWSWSFPGSNTLTSTVQNPQNIQYNTPGQYTVTLTVTDGTNSSTEIKTAFITVQQPANSAWIEQASGFAQLYRGAYNISIVSDSIAWSTAIDGTTGAAVKEYTRTTNAGTTWTPGTINVTGSFAPSNIVAMTDQKAWVGMYPTTGAGGKVYITTDGGTTWTGQGTTAMFSNSASFLNIAHFYNELEGYCMGDPVSNVFEIYTTSDGGLTWTAVPSANIPVALSGEMGWTGVYDAFGNVSWFGTNKGRIFKSTDKGLTWTVLTPGLTDVQKITFNNENNGIAQQIVYNTSTGAITTLTMKVTNDGGATWNTVTPGVGMGKSDICAVPNLPGKYYSVGTDGGASSAANYNSSYSLDYGTTWTVVDTAVQYISVEFMDDYTGWAGGFSQNATTSGIFKWDTNVSVPKNDNDVESTLLYPNPSNGNISINFGNLQGKISIVVYDIFGKEISSANTDINLGQILNFDFSNFAKGIYIAKINSKNEQAVHKFVIE
ncbi:MAG: S8 family serine peptidase [Bacteroidia bacterium]|nr:S8 family serine peptidase [Bacteroidia bacterium]